MDLFDLIDALIDKKKYRGVPDSVKKKHFFMVQRFMSIKHPIEANLLNKIDINQVAVVDFWHKVMSHKFTRKPKFLFTKTRKGKKDKLSKIKSRTKSFFMQKKRLGTRDFEFLCEVHPKETYDHLRMIEKLVKENSTKL